MRFSGQVFGNEEMLCFPARQVIGDRPHNGDPVLLLAVDQHVRVRIALVDEMLRWQ